MSIYYASTLSLHIESTDSMIVLKLTLLEKLCLPIGRFTCFKYCQQYLTSLNMRINWGM